MVMNSLKMNCLSWPM